MPTEERLVKAAYDALRDRVVRNLEGELRQQDRIIEKADEEMNAFWLRVRARGIPDRRAERDATLKLLEQVRRLQHPPGWGES